MKISPVSRVLVFLLVALAGPSQALRAQTVLSGTYNNQTINDSVSIPTGSATFTNGSTFTGPNATFGASSGLYWNQNVVTPLDGKLITFGNGAYFYLPSANNAVTFGSGTTLTGNVSVYSSGAANTTVTNQGTINHTTGTGSLYSVSFTNSGAINATAGTLYVNYPSATYNFTNAGTITANNATVYLRGNFDNNGSVSASNGGILHWDGETTTANLGTVNAAGGTARFNGTVDNTAATLAAPASGVFSLYGGTIRNGTIASGALAFTTSGGYLDGATLTGDLNLSSASAYVRFTNAATFTGANATLGSSSSLYWQQVGTLADKDLTLGAGAYVYVAGANNSLTLDADTTVTGSASIYSDGSAGTTITNAGAITHTGGTGNLYATQFTNSGSITATSGTLYLNYPSATYHFTNTGSVTADNATVYVRGDFDNNGTLTAANGGILHFDGNTTSANLGTVNAGGGTARLNGLVDNTAANLAAPASGVFALYGGTIRNGTIDAGALAFTGSGGYLEGATLTGDLTLAGSAYVRFTNGATFTGANATLGSSAGLYWQQVGTLAGKTVSLGSSAYLYVAGANNSLTLASDTTVAGNASVYSDGSAGTTIANAGTITHTGGTGSLYATQFTNSGTIAANAGTLYVNYPSATYNFTNTGAITANNATVYLRGNFDNNGTVTAANGGILYWDGTNTTANLGNVDATGGFARLNGTLNNASANLAAPTGGGVFQLWGGTIAGGTIDNNALAFTSSGGYLDGATLTGDLNLSAGSANVRFVNGASFTGAGATFGSSGHLYWQQVGTLSGKNVAMGSGSFIQVAGANNALTFAADTTLTGSVSVYSDGNAGTTITNAGAINHTGGTGNLYATQFANSGTITATGGTLYANYPSSPYNFTNTGSMVADGASTTLYLRGNLDNNGTITAQNNGTLRWDGNTATANLGTVVLAGGGKAQLNGNLDNSATTLAAPTGGSFQLYGGTITGGNIAPGALAFTSSGGTLSGVGYAGDLNLASGTSVTFTNGTSFSGSAASIATSAALYWNQAGTLAAKALSFGSTSYGNLGVGNGGALTFAPDTTVTGHFDIYGNTGSTIVNQGAIAATGGTSYLYGPSVANWGSVTVAPGSNLYLGYYGVSNQTTNASTGTIVSSGTLYLGATLQNLGLLHISSGTLYTNDYLVLGGNGILKGAGTISGDVTIAGGQIHPGNSIGTMTFANADFTVTGHSTLILELSGSTADKITFQNPGTINLNNGLLGLSISLLSAPALYTSYTIMNIASGPGTILGSFQAQPNSGDWIASSFGGNDYYFQVFYNGNSISVMSIPEPGTYALLALGGLMAAGMARLRRRK